MSEYYYFCATLTTASFSSPQPILYIDFLAKAREFLKSDDYASLAGATLHVMEDGSFPVSARASQLLFSYYSWDLAVVNELTRLRALRSGKNPSLYQRPGEPEWYASKAAQTALTFDSPLEAELYIERERWMQIDRLETGHYFDLEHLLAYALKLQILERLKRFERERGVEAYKKAYDSILAGATLIDKASAAGF